MEAFGYSAVVLVGREAGGQLTGAEGPYFVITLDDEGPAQNSVEVVHFLRRARENFSIMEEAEGQERRFYIAVVGAKLDEVEAVKLTLCEEGVMSGWEVIEWLLPEWQAHMANIHPTPSQ